MRRGNRIGPFGVTRQLIPLQLLTRKKIACYPVTPFLGTPPPPYVYNTFGWSRFLCAKLGLYITHAWDIKIWGNRGNRGNGKNCLVIHNLSIYLSIKYLYKNKKKKKTPFHRYPYRYPMTNRGNGFDLEALYRPKVRQNQKNAPGLR